MAERRVLLLAVVTDLSDVNVTYPSCQNCYCKLLVDPATLRYHCVKCSVDCHQDQVQWRYRLVMTISDGSTSGAVVVFGKTLEYFFGKTATDFQRSLFGLVSSGFPTKSMLTEALLRTFYGKCFYFGFKTFKSKDLVDIPTLKDVLTTANNFERTYSDWSSNFKTSHSPSYQLLACNEEVCSTVTDYMRTFVKNIKTCKRQSTSKESASYIVKNSETSFSEIIHEPHFSQMCSLPSSESAFSPFSKHEAVKFSFEEESASIVGSTLKTQLNSQRSPHSVARLSGNMIVESSEHLYCISSDTFCSQFCLNTNELSHVGCKILTADWDSSFDSTGHISSNFKHSKIKCIPNFSSYEINDLDNVNRSNDNLCPSSQYCIHMNSIFTQNLEFKNIGQCNMSCTGEIVDKELQRRKLVSSQMLSQLQPMQTSRTGDNFLFENESLTRNQITEMSLRDNSRDETLLQSCLKVTENPFNKGIISELQEVDKNQAKLIKEGQIVQEQEVNNSNLDTCSLPKHITIQLNKSDLIKNNDPGSNIAESDNFVIQENIAGWDKFSKWNIGESNKLAKEIVSVFDKFAIQNDAQCKDIAKENIAGSEELPKDNVAQFKDIAKANIAGSKELAKDNVAESDKLGKEIKAQSKEITIENIAESEELAQENVAESDSLVNEYVHDIFHMLESAGRNSFFQSMFALMGESQDNQTFSELEKSTDLINIVCCGNNTLKDIEKSSNLEEFASENSKSVFSNSKCRGGLESSNNYDRYITTNSLQELMLGDKPTETIFEMLQLPESEAVEEFLASINEFFIDENPNLVTLNKINSNSKQKSNFVINPVSFNFGKLISSAKEQNTFGQPDNSDDQFKCCDNEPECENQACMNCVDWKHSGNMANGATLSLDFHSSNKDHHVCQSLVGGTDVLCTESMNCVTENKSECDTDVNQHETLLKNTELVRPASVHINCTALSNDQIIIIENLANSKKKNVENADNSVSFQGLEKFLLDISHKLEDSTKVESCDGLKMEKNCNSVRKLNAMKSYDIASFETTMFNGNATETCNMQVKGEVCQVSEVMQVNGQVCQDQIVADSAKDFDFFFHQKLITFNDNSFLNENSNSTSENALNDNVFSFDVPEESIQIAEVSNVISEIRAEPSHDCLKTLTHLQNSNECGAINNFRTSITNMSNMNLSCVDIFNCSDVYYSTDNEVFKPETGDMDDDFDEMHIDGSTHSRFFTSPNQDIFITNDGGRNCLQNFGGDLDNPEEISGNSEITSDKINQISNKLFEMKSALRHNNQVVNGLASACIDQSSTWKTNSSIDQSCVSVMSQNGSIDLFDSSVDKIDIKNLDCISIDRNLDLDHIPESSDLNDVVFVSPDNVSVTETIKHCHGYRNSQQCHVITSTPCLENKIELNHSKKISHLESGMKFFDKQCIKHVQFDKQLRRVSSCLLMDIKMQVLASPVKRLKLQCVPKSCLKTNTNKHLATDVHLRFVGEDNHNSNSAGSKIVRDTSNCLLETMQGYNDDSQGVHINEMNCKSDDICRTSDLMCSSDISDCEFINPTKEELGSFIAKYETDSKIFYSDENMCMLNCCCLKHKEIFNQCEDVAKIVSPNHFSQMSRVNGVSELSDHLLAKPIIINMNARRPVDDSPDLFCDTPDVKLTEHSKMPCVNGVSKLNNHLLKKPTIFNMVDVNVRRPANDSPDLFWNTPDVKLTEPSKMPSNHLFAKLTMVHMADMDIRRPANDSPDLFCDTPDHEYIKNPGHTTLSKFSKCNLGNSFLQGSPDILYDSPYVVSKKPICYSLRKVPNKTFSKKLSY